MGVVLRPEQWQYQRAMTSALLLSREGTIASLWTLLPILSSVPCACFLSEIPFSSAAAVSLRDLESRPREDCGHVEKECQYGCGGRYQRRFLQNHIMDECPQRPPEVVTQSLMRKMAERIDTLETIQAVHCEEQVEHCQQIQQLQDENLALKNEKKKMGRKISLLEYQVQQGWLFRLFHSQ